MKERLSLFLSSAARLSQPFWDPRLCVPASRLVYLYRKGTFYATDIMRDSCQQVLEDTFGELIIMPSNFKTLASNCRTLEPDWPVERRLKDK